MKAQTIRNSVRDAADRLPLLHLILRVTGVLITAVSVFCMTREAVLGPISFWFLLGGALFGLLVTAAGWLPPADAQPEGTNLRAARSRLASTSSGPSFRSAHLKQYTGELQ